MDKQTKNGLIIGGVILVGTAGYFGFKKVKADSQQKAAAKAITKGTNAQLGINIPEIAQQIGFDLGYAYPWYDPRRSTENDLAVRLQVLKVPKTHIPLLVKAYAANPNTKGRNLQADLNKVLDEYSEVSYLFK